MVLGGWQREVFLPMRGDEQRALPTPNMAPMGGLPPHGRRGAEGSSHPSWGGLAARKGWLGSKELAEWLGVRSGTAPPPRDGLQMTLTLRKAAQVLPTGHGVGRLCSRKLPG